MAVNVRPLPLNYQDIPPKLRPMPAPVFDSDPSAEDIAEARALFLALDSESQNWYRSEDGIFADLPAEPARTKPRKRSRGAAI